MTYGEIKQGDVMVWSDRCGGPALVARLDDEGKGVEFELISGMIFKFEWGPHYAHIKLSESVSAVLRGDVVVWGSL